MIVKYYKCTFKSDIVLPASSNTQGNVALNDFIPGSNFLGMVAKKYESFKEDSMSVFHNGDVQFGDGHISVNGKLSFKIPLSYHYIKTEESSYYNRLLLSADEERSLRNEQQQLKQVRDGFMFTDGSYVSPAYNYAQKSSHDKDLRKSKEGGMFGYSALSEGTEWIFKVTYKNESLIAAVEKQLLGSQYLGKSRSSQYGQVDITSSNNISEVDTFTPENTYTYLYVNSRLALHDEEGVFTVTPSLENLGFSAKKIVWDKTFIKTSEYTPYNYKRQSKEYTRACINKGSIITLEGCTDAADHKVGAFLSEGFGDILVNPKFLDAKVPVLHKLEEDEIGDTSIVKERPDTSLLNFLESKKKEEDDAFTVASDVQNVYKQLIGPSKSQWGEIRSIVGSAKDVDDLTMKIENYVKGGKSEKQWEGKLPKLLSEIRQSSDPLAFTKLLSMIVSKHSKGGNDE